jgi:2-hydroxychromene-2-carboxylate isomerase
VRAAIARTIAGLLTSPRLRDARRSVASAQRRLRGRPAVVHYFHQADDPYSHLMLQVLPAFTARHEVRLQPHLVPPPSDSAAPDRERLQAWSRRDAESLAAAVDLEFTDPKQQPAPALVELADRALAAASRDDAPLDSALRTAMTASGALWRSDGAALARLLAATDEHCAAMLEAGSALREKLGHYLGATLYFEGEWYWGIDRLWYLEQRLRSAGLSRAGDDKWIVQVPRVECRHRPTNGQRPELHFFCSLRSPYTYLAVARVLKLAQCYNARLQLRFVLPMVMRGLPVPRDKRLYILRDSKREAETLGLPFGQIVDPVGVPTERGLAVLHRAIGAGKGPQFLESFMRGVWADGLDAGSDGGLLKIAERAGLDDSLVRAALGDSSWREVARANREEMLALGLWGVPSFRVDANPSRWGQDRLWQVERDLIAATNAVRADLT